MALPRAKPQETPALQPVPGKVAVARPRLPAAEAILPYLQEIDEAGWYSNFGPQLTAFEDRLAERFTHPTQIITAVNATQAITLALQSMRLPPGAHVVVPAWTFVATAHAVVQAGLRPWFVDVDPATWMLDPAQMLEMAGRRRGEIAAVIPVAAFGAMPDLDAWLAFRETTGIPVLLDAAAAFDTLHDARLPAVVSLHATKALGIGEGGFLATTDARLAREVRQRTTFGFEGSRDSLIAATNAKLSEYAAAVGMAALDAWPADRLRFLRAAQHLRIALLNRPEVRFQEGWGADWVTSVCTVGLPEGSAGRVAKLLAAEGVDTRAWWGGGCQTSRAFTACRRSPLPATERLAGSTLGLPFAIDLDSDEIGRIARALDVALSPG